MKHRFFFAFRPVRCVLLALVAVILIVPKMQGQDLQFTPGIASTIAGDVTGNLGGSANNYTGPASELVLRSPYGINFDSAGNLYIASRGIVRVVAASNTSIPALPGVAVQAGYIYAFAGGGTVCSSNTDAHGNGCPATQATVSNTAEDMAIDAHGNVFIADRANSEIRVVYAGGTVPGLTSPQPGYIYSLAAAAAYFTSINDEPVDIAVDAQENIYFTNAFNPVLSVIYSGQTVAGNPLGIPSSTPVGGVYTLNSSYCSVDQPVCGDGGPFAQAQLANPVGVAVDSSGNLYFGDSGIGHLRVVYVAGNIPGLSNLTPGNVYTVAGGGPSQTIPALGEPATSASNVNSGQIVFDAAGDLYLASGSATIEKVDISGTLTTVFGGSANCAASTDGYGDGCPATSATFVNPFGVAVDSGGNMYASDDQTHGLIRKSTVSSSASSFAGTAGLPIASQIVVVSNVGSKSLQLSDLSFTGPFAQTPTGGTSDCSSSTSLAAGSTCILGISFTGTTVGTASGSLAVASNSLNASGGSNTVALGATLAAASSSTSLTASPAYPTVVNTGQTVTFTATTIPQTGDTLIPTGTVNLFSGTTQVGTGTLSNGVVTIPISNLPAGTLQITAQYGGDANFAGSTSNLALVDVSPASTVVPTVALIAGSATATSGQPVTLTATVTAPGGVAITSGTVSFQDGSNSLGVTATVNSSGVATTSISTLPPGANSLQAVFNGNGGYGSNISNSVSVIVTGGQLAFAPGVIAKIAGVYPTITDGQYGQPDQGYSGDGGPAGNATFGRGSPAAVAADSFGNVYIADSVNNVIRVVASGAGSIAGISSHTAGDIYTFAGGGTCPNGLTNQGCNDGGPALQAVLSNPTSVSVDAFGNVYIVDQGGSAIRRVNTQGVIQTIAGSLGGSYGYSGDGGLATSAQFDAAGIFVDNAGDLYIADGGTTISNGASQSNNLVRRVDALTGIITTVAGSTSGVEVFSSFGSAGNQCGAYPCGDGGPATNALLDNPLSIAIDAAGDLYIADSGDDVIRKVNSNTGIINTVVGSQHQSNQSGDGGPATSATLSYPNSIALDNAGDLYIDDSVNINNVISSRIREVSAQTGIINTIIGGGGCSPAPCGDGGLANNAELNASQIALDTQGNVYIADNYVARGVPVTSTAVAFGNQSLGTNNTQTFTVTNIGGAPLSLTGVAVATTSPVPPPSPSDFSQQPSGGADCAASMTLASGLSCAIDLQWFPTITTPETATLTVASNAVNSSNGNNVITLNGTGLGSSGSQQQTITFPLKPSYPYGTPIALAAATSATDPSLTISYRTNGPATLTGATVTPTGPGSVTVTAYQFGNALYASATPQSQSFSVTPAPLTVTAMEAPVTVGNPITAPTFAITGFVGSDTQASVVTGSPVLTITNTQTGATVPAGSVQPSGTYTVTITQGTLSAGPNYSLNFVNAAFSVTGTEGQTINFTALPNVTYGVGPIALTAVSTDAITKANTNLPITFTVNAPNTIAGNLLTVVAAGAVAVTATQSGNATYQEASQTASFTAAPAPLTVTAGNLTAAQNSTLPILTNDYSFSGFVNGDTQAAVTGTPMLSTTAADTSAVGTFPINITQGSLSSTNYAFKAFVPGTLTVIVGTAQTINFPAMPNVAYGSAPITLSAKASSGLGVSYAVTGGPAIVAGNTLSITGAGTVTVAASQPGSGSYAAATPVSQTFTVAPAVLNLIANNVTRMDNTPNPPFTFTLTGFVNGDTQGSATSGTPVYTTTATASSPAGTYPIIPSATYTNNGGLQTALSAANYTFNPINGTLTITSGGPASGFSLTASPQQLSILAGASAQTVISLAPQNYYQALVTLSCGTLPANVQCTFSPATVSPDGTGTSQTTTLTITTNSSAVVASLNQKNDTEVRSAAIFWLPGMLTGLLLVFYRKRLLKNPRLQQLLTLAVLFAGIVGLAACGTAAPSTATNGATPGTYTVTVTAKGQDGTTNVVPLSIQIR